MSYGWLAPAAACLLLAVSVLKQGDGGLTDLSDGSRQWTTVALSNQSYAPYLPANYRGSENRLDTFEWTNGGASFSSRRPLTPVGTDAQEGLWTK